MSKIIRYIVSVKFLLILLFFFMPFLTVSCQGQTQSLSGFDLAFGPDSQHSGLWQFLSLFVFAIIGVLVIFWQHTYANYLQAALAFVGMILMGLGKSAIDREAAANILSVQYNFAYMLTWVLLFFGFVASIYGGLMGARKSPIVNLDGAERRMDAVVGAIEDKAHGMINHARNHMADMNQHTQYNPTSHITLKSRHSQYPDLHIPPTGSSVIIGRSRRNKWVIDNTFVSGKHLSVKATEGGTVMVKDLSSTNGTWLDGIRLKPERYYPMNHGSRLRLGSKEVEYVL